MARTNVSFPKIQIQSAVQPGGNHSFLQVKRAMASYSSEPALSPSLQVAFVRTGRPPGASSNRKNGRPARYVLLRSGRRPRIAKERKRFAGKPHLQIIKSSSPILINVYKLSHYLETCSHEGTRRRFTSLPAVPLDL